MRNNNLLKDGDWMTKKEALRENLPAHFNDQDISAKLHEVRGGKLWMRRAGCSKLQKALLVNWSVLCSRPS